MEIQLVADTNLFFECKKLSDLPWPELSGDPIIVLLTKPVLDEIDLHKRAAGRTRNRAIEIYGQVRAMLTAGTNEVEIQPAAPRVVLRLASNAVPLATLSDKLDYRKNDEKLIGIVASLLGADPEHSVILFTDDTGPAATAAGLGIPFQLIDEHWRRPAGQSSEEKLVRELERDIALYKSQEPKITITGCDPADAKNAIVVTKRIALPLTEPEVDQLIANLEMKHPMVLEVVPPADSSVVLDSGETIITSYSAPSEEAVKSYQESHYKSWIAACRETFETLQDHVKTAEPDLILTWAMSNSGTRPATSVRVDFSAQGPLLLQRLKNEDKPDLDLTDEPYLESDENGNEADTIVEAKLPNPPRPPSPEKQITRVPPVPRILPESLNTARLGGGLRVSDHLARTDVGALLGLDGMRGISAHLKDIERMNAASNFLGRSDVGLAGSIYGEAIKLAGTGPYDVARIMPRIPYAPPKHDPEAFYYDEWSPVNGGLTCDLWRHQNEEELFQFEVLIPGHGAINGSVTCRVHAENLTIPVTLRVTVRRIIEEFSLLEFANELVEACG